jgi:hypothetical protein
MFGRFPAAALVTLAGEAPAAVAAVLCGVATAALPLAVVGATDPAAALPGADGIGAAVPVAEDGRLHASSAATPTAAAPSCRSARRPTLRESCGMDCSFMIRFSIHVMRRSGLRAAVPPSLPGRPFL